MKRLRLWFSRWRAAFVARKQETIRQLWAEMTQQERSDWLRQLDKPWFKGPRAFLLHTINDVK